MNCIIIFILFFFFKEKKGANVLQEFIETMNCNISSHRHMHLIVWEDCGSKGSFIPSTEGINYNL